MLNTPLKNTTKNTTAQFQQLRKLCLRNPEQALELCRELETETDPEKRILISTCRTISLETLGQTAAAEMAQADTRNLLDRMLRDWKWADLTLNRGWILFEQGLHQQALAFFLQAQTQAQAQQETLLEATAWTRIGHMYDVIDDYPKALEAGMKSLALQRLVGNLRGEADAHQIIAIVLDNNGEQAQALEHFQESVRLILQTDNLSFTINCLQNLAESLADAKRYDQAFQTAQQALELAERLQDSNGIGEVHLSLGRIHAILENHSKAVEHLEQSLKIMESDARLERITNIKLDLAQAHLRNNHFGTQTLDLLEQSLRDSIEGQTKSFETIAHELLSEYHERSGNPTLALEHHKHLRRLETELSDAQIKGQYQSLSVQHGLEQAQEHANKERQQRQALELANLENLRLLHELQAKSLQLEQLAMRDGLTGLFNRRYIEAHLDREYARASRLEQSLCVAIIDIDHFKTINDSFSHAVGDEVLRRMADIFVTHVRVGDQIARFGGEEFVLVLPDMPLELAVKTCERLRAAIEGFAWSCIHSALRVTVSVGLSNNAGTQQPKGMLHRADLYLYEAKHMGRNRIAALTRTEAI